MPRVFVDRFDPVTLKASVTQALAWVRAETIITSSTRVFIKPNLTWLVPTPGVTVTPAFIRAVVEALLPFSRHITIGESEGGQACFQAEDAFEQHGLYELRREYGINVVNLSRDEQERVTTTIGGKAISVDLPQLLLHDIDVFITLPVPKVHALTMASLGFKNQWGCLGDKMRVTRHPEFDRAILAINKVLKPRLCIFDGTYFLDYTGPIMGEAVPMNTIIVGDDVGAASLVCCEVMGLDPMSVPHQRLARTEGMFPASLASVELNAQPQEFSQRAFRLKRSFINYIHLMAFKSRLVNRFFYDSMFADAAHDVLWFIRRQPLVRRFLYGKYGPGEANRGGRAK